MDLHKQLNALQAGLAEETIDGAAAYGLADADRPRVAAFMAGLNRTARLKFDHPGLGTTATRCGDRLVIQNDIGTTDAHVVVIHVEGLTVSVTYTDVHEQRLRFFQDMLASKAAGVGNRRSPARSPAARRSTSPPAASTPRTRRPARRPGIPRLAPGVPDRLEPRPQAAPRLPAAARRGSRCCIGRRRRRSGIAASSNSAGRG